MAQTGESGTQTAAELARQLSKRMLNTVTAYGLIEEGDRILVALSGGKDSYSLMELLWQAQRKAPIQFELLAVHLDQRQPGHDCRPLKQWLESQGIPFRIIREDTYSVVMADAEKNPKATYCRICSRLRRGILYKAAEAEGCNKIALGHHRDDSLETLLMNLFYSGRLQAMPPMYTTNDGNYQVIRPLIECGEREIAALASQAGYPILPCNLCGSVTDAKRVYIAELLAKLEEKNPMIRQVMLAALKNVRPSHLLDHEVAEAWASQAGKYTPRR
jgi:tRNA 2-thiocytidine biosynthesis protein TtcA